MTDSPSAQDLHAELVRVVELVDGLDLRQLEGRPPAEVHEALFGPTDRALRDSVAVLGQVLGRYDGASIAPPPREEVESDTRRDREFDLGIDQIVLQVPSAGRVADLGFMASIELKQKLARVSQLRPTDDPWRLLAVLGSAGRRVRKSLTAVATVLSAFEGIETPLNFASELASSLEVRRVYARLRESIAEGREPDEDELHARLRGVGTQIAILVGREIYPELRVDDRMELRRLQQRILAWLRTPGGDPERQTEGRRLWQDLSGFARVLAQVSHRQELLEHDAHVVAIAHGALFGGAGRQYVPDRLFERLRALRGLDDDVDRLLAEEVLAAERWRPALSRLAERFGRGPTAQTSAQSAGEVEWL